MSAELADRLLDAVTAIAEHAGRCGWAAGTLVDDIRVQPQASGQVWVRLIAAAPADSEITGKFLFFDRDLAPLVAVAAAELRSGAHWQAKVSVQRSDSHAEHCLCLYAPGPAAEEQLRSRHAPVRLHGFKTEQQTRQDAARRAARRR